MSPSAEGLKARTPLSSLLLGSAAQRNKGNSLSSLSSSLGAVVQRNKVNSLPNAVEEDGLPKTAAQQQPNLEVILQKYRDSKLCDHQETKAMPTTAAGGKGSASSNAGAAVPMPGRDGDAARAVATAENISEEIDFHNAMKWLHSAVGSIFELMRGLSAPRGAPQGALRSDPVKQIYVAIALLYGIVAKEQGAGPASENGGEGGVAARPRRPPRQGPFAPICRLHATVESIFVLMEGREPVLDPVQQIYGVINQIVHMREEWKTPSPRLRPYVGVGGGGGATKGKVESSQSIIDLLLPEASPALQGQHQQQLPPPQAQAQSDMPMSSLATGKTGRMLRAQSVPQAVAQQHQQVLHMQRLMQQHHHQHQSQIVAVPCGPPLVAQAQGHGQMPHGQPFAQHGCPVLASHRQSQLQRLAQIQQQQQQQPGTSAAAIVEVAAMNSFQQVTHQLHTTAAVPSQVQQISNPSFTESLMAKKAQTLTPSKEFTSMEGESDSATKAPLPVFLQSNQSNHRWGILPSHTPSPGARAQLQTRPQHPSTVVFARQHVAHPSAGIGVGVMHHP